MLRVMAILGGVVAASTAIGIGGSLYYWRYPISPPPLLAEMRTLSAVDRISRIDGLNPPANAPLTMEPVDVEPFNHPADWDLDGDPTLRLARKLHADGVPIGTLPAASAELAAALWEASERARLLTEGTPEYRETKMLCGYIGAGRLADGSEVAFATVSGYEYSNDHYPYYEFVARPDGDRWTVTSSQGYFYDLAGMEGLTWIPMAVMSFVLLAPVGLFALVFSRPGKQRESIS